MRETIDNHTVLWEDDSPLPRIEYKKLYLDATDGKLKLDISGIYRGGESIEVPFGHSDTVNKGMH